MLSTDERVELLIERVRKMQKELNRMYLLILVCVLGGIWIHEFKFHEHLPF